jgi:hypothetical protein
LLNIFGETIESPFFIIVILSVKILLQLVVIAKSPVIGLQIEEYALAINPYGKFKKSALSGLNTIESLVKLINDG